MAGRCRIPFDCFIFSHGFWAVHCGLTNSGVCVCVCACECVAGDKHRHHHRHYLDAKSRPAGHNSFRILRSIIFVSAIWFSSFRAPSARPRVQVRASYIGRFRPPGAGARVVGAPLARFHSGRSVDAQWTLQWTLSGRSVFTRFSALAMKNKKRTSSYFSSRAQKTS